MRLTTTLGFLLVMTVSGLTAQSSERAEQQLLSAMGLMSTHADVLTITDFPVTTREAGTLQLRRRRSAIDATTQCIVPTVLGDKRVNSPELTMYSGAVQGAAGSRVWLAYSEGLKQVFGIVQYANGTSYVVGPSSEQGAAIGQHVVAATTAIRLPKQAAFTCAAGELTSEQIARQSEQIAHQSEQIARQSKNLMTPIVLESKPLLQVDLAVETDVEFFKATGGTLEKAQAYTAALYSVLSAIYEDEVHVTVHLSWVKTWTDEPADPYFAKGDPFTLRDAAVPYWKNSYQAVKRDVYQVLTSSSFGSGGFGYYDALCDKNGDYGMSAASVQGYNALPTFAFSYDVYIVAHELGHNFNAEHTHSCRWNPPLDTCMVDEGLNAGCFTIAQQPKPNPGSIMSYCGGINNDNGLGYQVRMTFLAQVAAVMRATVEAAECVFAPSNSFVHLIAPNGQETYAKGDRINIRWRATPDVGWMRLDYSKNGGQQWTVIEERVDAASETYMWVVPDVCSNRMLVRLKSTFDSAVADQSMQVFTITGAEDPNGLVAWYPMDGNSEDYAPCGFYPASGNAALAPDKSNTPKRAYSFGDSTKLAAPSFETDFDTFTVACWFKVSDRAGVQTFVAQDWSGAGSTFMLYSWEGTLGGALYIQGQGSPTQIWGPALSTNQWYHVAYVYDGANAQLYVDGVGGTLSGVSGALARHKSPLFIGSRGTADYLRGSLDDIRIYRRALAAEEIVALFNGTSGVEESTIESIEIRTYISVDASTCEVTLVSNGSGTIELTLCDRLGKSVAYLEGFKRDAGAQTFSLDVSSVASGAYFVVAKCGNARAVAKVTIVR